ncbi:MAG: metal-dependent hydrolase [Candidatus Saliniplasma sp.]
MHPIIHVATAILIGLGMGFHSKRRYLIVILGALGVNGFLDIDYILKGSGFMGIRYFHTGIGMLYIPVLILLGAHLYERRKGSSILTRGAVFVLIVALSHLVLDTFSGDTPVRLYYPITLQEYTFDGSLLPLAFIFFIGITAAANVIETYLYNNNEGMEPLPEEPGENLAYRYSERMYVVKGTLDDL